MSFTLSKTASGGGAPSTTSHTESTQDELEEGALEADGPLVRDSGDGMDEGLTPAGSTQNRADPDIEKYNPSQPRVAAGNTGGGEFAAGSSSSSSSKKPAAKKPAAKKPDAHQEHEAHLAHLAHEAAEGKKPASSSQARAEAQQDYQQAAQLESERKDLQSQLSTAEQTLSNLYHIQDTGTSTSTSSGSGTSDSSGSDASDDSGTSGSGTSASDTSSSDTGSSDTASSTDDSGTSSSGTSSSASSSTSSQIAAAQSAVTGLESQISQVTSQINQLRAQAQQLTQQAGTGKSSPSAEAAKGRKKGKSKGSGSTMAHAQAEGHFEVPSEKPGEDRGVTKMLLTGHAADSPANTPFAGSSSFQNGISATPVDQDAIDAAGCCAPNDISKSLASDLGWATQSRGASLLPGSANDSPGNMPVPGGPPRHPVSGRYVSPNEVIAAGHSVTQSPPAAMGSPGVWDVNHTVTPSPLAQLSTAQGDPRLNPIASSIQNNMGMARVQQLNQSAASQMSMSPQLDNRAPSGNPGYSRPDYVPDTTPGVPYGMTPQRPDGLAAMPYSRDNNTMKSFTTVAPGEKR
jgi:hypothetical protein